MIDRKLGRGLDYLIGEGRDESEDEVRQVEITAIRRNPFQPRKEFDREALRELADRLRDQIGSGIVVLASAAGSKALLVVVVTQDLTEIKKLEGQKRLLDG